MRDFRSVSKILKIPDNHKYNTFPYVNRSTTTTEI